MFGYDIFLGAQKIIHRLHNSLNTFQLLAYEACTPVMDLERSGNYNSLK